MAQGGDSARLLVVGILLFSVLQYALLVEGATYVVGDGQGWGFQIQSSRWTAGKNFKAGDILGEFQFFKAMYLPPFHNVVAVDEGRYHSCSTGGSRPLTSGNDRIVLKMGVNYFICSVPGHCSLARMKLAVTAA